jgi:hypothetical protein
MAKKFYKTIITVEVLHEDKVEFNDLQEVASSIASGDCSGQWSVVSCEPITSKQMAEECVKQSSDPEFFGIDDNGQELE